MEPVLLPGHFHGRGGNGAAADEERETRPACLGVEAGCDAGRDEQHGFRRIYAVEAGPAREPVEAVVPPDGRGEAEEGSGLGIEHPRAVEAARGFPAQGAAAFQRQEGVHVFDDGVGRHDDGGRFIVPFFLHALEFHGKGVFRVDAGRDGYGANASGHAERRRAGFRAEMPAIEQDVPDRQRFKVVGPRPQAAAASGPRNVYGFFGADRVVDVLPKAARPHGLKNTICRHAGNETSE